MKKDKQLTALAGFADERSYVTPDKREVLFGDDWKARIDELRRRSGGQCERVVQVGTGLLAGPLLERCSAEAVDPHHIIRRSVKRDDRLSNLLALCRYHHDQLDERKPRWNRGEAMRQAKGG